MNSEICSPFVNFHTKHRKHLRVANLITARAYVRESICVVCTRRGAFFCMLLLSLIFPARSFLWDQVLESIQVPGGRVTAVGTDPTGSIWYAGVKDGVLFRSDNAGQTGAIANWTQWLGAVEAIAVNPDNSDEIYVGGRKSTDGGYSWSSLSMPALRHAINPLDPNVVYGVVGSPLATHVVVSRDAGAIWDTLFSFSQVVSLIRICPQDTAVLYAAADSGIFKSINSGRSWERVFTRWIREIQIAPSNNDIVYAADNFGFYNMQRLYKTTNGGLEWIEITDTSFMNEPINEISVHTTNPHTLYLATGDWLKPLPGDVHKSTDGGLTWSRKGNGLPPRTERFCYPIKVDPARPDSLIVGTYGFGTFKSTDGAENWNQTTLTHSSILSVYIDPDSSSNMYVGTFDQGILSSNDAGTTWQQLNLGTPWSYNTYAYAYRIDRNNRLVRYLTAGRWGVFKSTDGGVSWNFSGVPGGFSTLTWDLALHPGNSDIAYAGQSGFMDRDLYRTTDGGGCWENLHLTNNESAVQEILFDEQNSSITYVGTSEQGIYKTIDNGQSWFQINNGLLITQPPYFSPVEGLVTSEQSTSVLYCAQRHGLLKSSTGGSNWNLIDSTLRISLPQPIYFDVSLRPNSSVLYAGVKHHLNYSDTLGGIFRTTNDGETWMKVAALPYFIEPYSLTISPSNAYPIYIATRYGLFRLTDSLLVGIDEKKDNEVVTQFTLSQNYPNPFNSQTTIHFQIKNDGWVSLKVYDMIGRKVGTLVNQRMKPGRYKALWDARDLASGVYLYRLKASNFSQTKKMVLIR